MDKLLSRLTKKKEKVQVTNIRNETGDTTIDLTDIKRKIRKYYEQLHTHKFENLNEMD